MRKLDIKKGDAVLVKVIEGSNSARGIAYMIEENIDRWLFEGEVLSVGRKYITVMWGRTEEKFEIDDDYKQKSEYCKNYKLYLSKQEIVDEVESEKLYDEIRHKFSNWRNNNKFALDQLRKISEIIKESEYEED